MKTLGKALLGTVAAGTMTLSAATPTLARDHGGISAGEVVAGALVIGGIAAIAASANNHSGYYPGDRGGFGHGYGNFRDNPRDAVQSCVQAAERSANRYSYGGRADVTDVRDIRNTRWGFEVRGRIAVNSMGRGWRNGDSDYGRGWGNDYRGWNSSMRGYDSGSFTCRFERGRVTDLDFDGIRGL